MPSTPTAVTKIWFDNNDTISVIETPGQIGPVPTGASAQPFASVIPWAAVALVHTPVGVAHYVFLAHVRHLEVL